MKEGNYWCEGSSLKVYHELANLFTTGYGGVVFDLSDNNFRGDLPNLTIINGAGIDINSSGSKIEIDPFNHFH